MQWYIAIFSSFLSTSHGVFTGAAWDSVEFTEHYPFQFRRIRLAMGVTDDLFASSFSATIKERLTEGGASGAFFFFSKGETYVAKSCAEEEVNVLRSIVGVYADFIVSNPKSYVCKILGAFTLLIYGNRLHFYIMSNLFSNNLGLSVHEKYDIKGSWVARNAQPPVEGKSYTCSYCEQKFVYKKSRGLNKLLRRLIRSGVSSKGLSRVRNTFEVVNKRHNSRDNDTFSPLGTALEQLENGDQEFEDLGYHCPFTVSGNHEPNIVLKDNDLKLKMRLPFSVAIDLLKQLQADAEFLASLGIMDYSLLLGVHNTEYEVKARNDSANTLGNGAPRLSLFPKSRPISTNKTSSNQQEDISTSKLVDGNRILAGSESIACTSPINIEGLSIEKDRMPSVDAKSCHYSRSTESNESLVTVSSCTGGANHMLKVSKVVGPETYFIGIIDILQKWNWKKKVNIFIVLLNYRNPSNLVCILFSGKDYIRLA
ncbi:hypothetical protein EON65_17835 [archaeon]|nr:MAG: hypothetical protein EON65_17835 [archaeon]